MTATIDTYTMPPPEPEQPRSGFFDTELFPVPGNVAARMIAKLQNKDAENFLEPSAGKGDLAKAIKGFGNYGRQFETRRKVDCIEIDPELASLCSAAEFPVVGYDWLTYTGVCYYDAIVMNPPFSNGDEHLLKAWDFMHDGEIVCLLNEETVKNPCTERRRRLTTIIAEHGDIEYLGDCFSRAQRKTDVRVAMVYLRKHSDDDRIDVWGTPTEEKPINDDIGASAEDCMLAVRDTLGNMQHYYDRANEHMLKAFAHIRKAALYMEANDITTRHSSDGYESVLKLALSNVNDARAEFSRLHRRDAWKKVFDKMDFHKFLDKKQRDQLLRDIETSANIPFTADNIKATLENVFMQRKKLFEMSVANVFDELIRHYKGNSCSEGWKTNDSYKVNEKLIFPWGCHWCDIMHKFDRMYSHHTPIDLYCDLDRILAVLDASRFEEILTIGQALERAFDRLSRGETRPNTAQSSYFDIRFFKKGTVHLQFRDRKLWETFNWTAAAGKKWLGQNTNGKSEWPGRRPTYTD